MLKGYVDIMITVKICANIVCYYPLCTNTVNTTNVLTCTSTSMSVLESYQFVCVLNMFSTGAACGIGMPRNFKENCVFSQFKENCVFSHTNFHYTIRSGRMDGWMDGSGQSSDAPNRDSLLISVFCFVPSGCPLYLSIAHFLPEYRVLNHRYLRLSQLVYLW